MNYDNDLYPTISPEDEATYMSQFDSDYDDSHFDADAEWRDEDFEPIDDGYDEEPYRAEDAFLDSYYEECFEMDLGCDW